MPENTHHLQLTLLSLIFDPLTIKQTYYSIRLTKGLWSQRQVCFRVPSGCQTLIFQSNAKIDFSYTPITGGRKDTLFRLVLEEIGELSQLGDISFSTKELANVFWNDKRMILEGQKLITPYITIKYQIKRSLSIRTEPKIGFSLTFTANDLMSQIFDLKPESPKLIKSQVTYSEQKNWIDQILLSNIQKKDQIICQKKQILDESLTQPASQSIPTVKNHDFIESQAGIRKRPARLLSKLLLYRSTSDQFQLKSLSSMQSVGSQEKKNHYKNEMQKKPIPLKNTLMSQFNKKKQISLSGRLRCITFVILLGILFLIFKIVRCQIQHESNIQ